MPRYPRKVRRMPEGISKSAPTKTARIQRRPDGGLLGVAVFLPAEIVEQYVDNSTETLNFDLIAAPEGIFIEIEEVHHRKHWQTKPLTRLCGMMRAAIALLWVLRELLG